MTDKIETLNKRLKEVVDKFNKFQRVGIDEEILEIYLQYKTKLSRTKVKEFLRCYEDFHRKLIKEEIIKGLKE